MWIINYLLRNAGRVISLVTTFFDRIIDAARNAWEWAVDQANKAKNKAIAWARGKIDQAQAFLIILINGARNLAWTLWNSAKSFARGIVDSAIAFLKGLIQAVQNLAWGLYNQAKAFVLEQVAKAKAILDRIIKAALKELEGLIEGWPELRGFVKELKAFFSEDNLARLNSLLKEGYQTLTIIISNPLGFIIAYWRIFLLQFLNYALGYAMGSVKYDLPPWPDWSEQGNGGPYPNGPVPDPIPDGLTPPLSTLRISGHRFRPGHPGLDLGCGASSPVFAAHSGTVETAGWSTIGYGENVTLRGNGWWTRYAHLVVNGIEAGDEVSAGQIIGLCDDTGNSTGNHLHFEVKRNGVFVDPAPLLGLS